MSDEACPLPSDQTSPDTQAIERMLRARRIAVVGLSDEPSRASFRVSQYLQQHGYEIIPVNPNHAEVLGEVCYGALSEVPRPVDVVLVFRRSEYCAQVAEEAIDAAARGLWLQAGIRNERAKQLAAEAQIDFVQDRCMMIEHMHRVRG